MWTKRHLILLTISSLFLASGVTFIRAAESEKRAPPNVAPSVDLNRYLGKWYELASIPASFQKQCETNTTAEYKLLKHSRIEVLNACLTKEGIEDKALGRAKVKDTASFAKLKVTFVHILTWIYLFGGDYWILRVDGSPYFPDYQVSLIGHPKRKYAWVLSRTPTLSMEQWRSIEEKYRTEGYDTCKILTSRQSAGLSERVPLCEFVVR